MVPKEGVDSPVFENSAEMYRFSSHEDKKDPLDSWHSMLPELKGKIVEAS